MCGILGICLDNRTRTEDDLVNIKADFANILLESQVRGTDATGVYIVNRDSGISYLKAPMDAEDMVWSTNDKSGFWQALDAKVGPDTVAIIGHTRAATTGSPECNDNNHPIIDAPIIGVHNGVIRNHRELDRKYPKAAEVDSAVIMSMLKAKSGDKPLTAKVIAKVYPELVGPAAIAVADTRQTDRVFLARNYNPINITRERDAGILMFASTAEILKSALGDDIKTFSMPENTVCQVNHKSVSGNLVYVPIKGTQASSPVAKKAKSFPTVQARFGKDVDAGERCPKCGQLCLMVYIGNQETKCCPCNPYGSDLKGTGQGDTKKAKATAKRPTSAKKGGSKRPVITWVLDSESTTISMSGAMDFHQNGPRGHFFKNGCTVAIVQQCGHPTLGGVEPHCPKKEKPCDCTADSSKFQFLGNGRTRHHHAVNKIDDGKARKGKQLAKATK